MKRENLFIYGFILTNGKEIFDIPGIESQGVYSQYYKDIAAVISNSSPIKFDSIPKERLLTYLASYQVVIEKLMETNSIIPMKFGTLATNKKELEQILIKGYERIKSSLIQMNNKLELEVVAIWENFDDVLKEIKMEYEIKRFKEIVESMPKDRVREGMISIGRIIKQSVDKKKYACASEIIDCLKGETVDFVHHDVLNDSMILNAAFLMEKEDAVDFEAKIHRLDKHMGGKIIFRIVGPLPPYSFSTLELNKIDCLKLNVAQQILGLGDDATIPEIQEAYNHLCRQLHPDKNPGDQKAQKKFEEINEAFQILNEFCRGEKYSFRQPGNNNWVTIRQVDHQRFLGI